MARRCAIAVAAFVFAAPAIANADAAAEVKAAAQQFFNSLGKSTPQATLALTDNFADERPFVLVVDAYHRARYRLIAAMTQRFGRADEIGRDDERFERLRLMIESANVAIRGNDASIYGLNEKPKDGIRMRKVNGVWKFRCIDYPHDSADYAAFTAGYVKMINTMADEVSAGVYPTYADAVRTYHERMMKPVLDKLRSSDLFKDKPAGVTPKP